MVDFTSEQEQQCPLGMSEPRAASLCIGKRIWSLVARGILHRFRSHNSGLARDIDLQVVYSESAPNLSATPCIIRPHSINIPRYKNHLQLRNICIKRGGCFCFFNSPPADQKRRNYSYLNKSLHKCISFCGCDEERTRETSSARCISLEERGEGLILRRG